MNGVINFYKPPGMTSAQAVAFIKRLAGCKAGHAGTLDPEAAGVLPIMLGRATRICDLLMALPKQYLAEIAFGAATDTQDAQGKVIATGNQYPGPEELKEAALGFVGLVQQKPPQYSALKVGGRSAHRLARSGEQVDLKPREIRFDSIDVIDQIDSHRFLMRVRCGKGAYIRTLCHDLGMKLGCPAHLRFLLREECGGLSLAGSKTVRDIQLWQESGFLPDQSLLLDAGTALRHLRRFELPAALRFQAVNGVPLGIVDIPGAGELAPGSILLLNSGQDLIGIYKRGQEHLRVMAMLYENQLNP